MSTTQVPSKIIFISSDSGSTQLFRDYEDGFGAYGASKAALNQMLRHMAAELKRKGGIHEDVCVLAMHPGEVQTCVLLRECVINQSRANPMAATWLTLRWSGRWKA